MSETTNLPLAKPLRTQLENAVKVARDVAEKGARAALAQLAVGESKAPDYLTDDLKILRRRLCAHGLALGDAKFGDDSQGAQHLVWEVADEHWHRMPFARFLAENSLLLWEPGAAVSLDDYEALAQEADPAMSLHYHRLDAKLLERIIHTYLDDWIRQQEPGVRSGADRVPTRLATAQDLKHRLELILEGNLPYDIFVRWKPLAEQPVGCNPDLNDGARLNIRPFMTAEVLRHNKKPKLNITWDKDRGKDVESAPWFKVFKGERINDHHLTRAEKLVARDPGRGS